jgi:hypothetical protein
LIGLPFLVTGLLLWRSSRTFMATAVKADGVVVELLRSGKGYKPAVEFTDDAGMKHRLVGKVSSSPPAYDVGETVKVAYARGKPGDGKVVGFLELYFLPIMMGGLGTVFSVLGTMFMIFMRAEPSPQRRRARERRIKRLRSMADRE